MNYVSWFLNMLEPTITMDMENIRSFIAAQLPADLQFKLHSVINQLEQHGIDSIRWIPIENIHLTLQFLGETPKSKIPVLSTMLEMVVNSSCQFRVSLSELGAFPTMNTPRVIWIGIKTQNELFQLQQLIVNEINQLDFKIEKRQFTPHLTLGRIKRTTNKNNIRQISDRLLKADITIMKDPVIIDTIILFQSLLQPQGATYIPLATAGLPKKLVNPFAS